MFICRCTAGKKKELSSMKIGNAKLVQERFPKHSCMGTARIKQDKEKEAMKEEEEKRSKKRGVSMERSKAGRKEKEVPTA